MTEEPAEDIERFTEQARWLITYHHNRSESLSSRAVALLGFVGVILALLLGSGVPDDVVVDWPIRATSAATVLLLLGTGGCCLSVLRERELRSPGVRQVRENWQAWVKKERRDRVATDIAETFLVAKDLEVKSPIEWTLETANDRADWFGRAVVFLTLSMASLTVLLALVGAQIYF